MLLKKPRVLYEQAMAAHNWPMAMRELAELKIESEKAIAASIKTAKDRRLYGRE